MLTSIAYRPPKEVDLESPYICIVQRERERERERELILQQATLQMFSAKDY